MGKKEVTFLMKKKRGEELKKKKSAGFHLLLKTAQVTLWLQREPRTEGKIHHFSKKWAFFKFLRLWG